MGQKKRSLFLARDRFGIKPLYYANIDGKFIFASEIKAILQCKPIIRLPNDKIIYQYLLYGVHDHTEETFFKGIMALLPAHFMIVDKNGMKIRKYWDLKVNTENDKVKNEGEVEDKLYDLLENSIKRHLVSEVPVGTCLSGGLDSSVIVCMINKLLRDDESLEKIIGKRQKSFSAVYEEKDIDERKYIEEVVKYTKIEKNYTFPTSKNLWDDLEKIVYYQDEPFFSSGIYAQWEVMRLASKKVKVVLDGQGGDEVFAGYIPYFGIYFLNLRKDGKYLQLMKEFLLSMDLTLPFLHKFIFKPKKEVEIKKLFNSGFVDEFGQKSRSKWEGDNLAEFLSLEITKNSLPRLLRYEDRNSMAFSIESRVPFLDHRIVEYVFSLPMNQRIKNGWTKHILRNAVKGYIPEKIRKRRSKVGFAVPERKWLLELRGKIMKIFLSEEFKKRIYFNQKEIIEKFKELCDGKLDDDYARIFWRILILEIWLEVFIDKK